MMLEGKVAVVTGSGGGVGREIAVHMALAGAKVVINDIGASLSGEGQSATPAQQTKQIIEQRGGQAEINTDSVSSWNSAGKIVQSALDHFGRAPVLWATTGTALAGVLLLLFAWHLPPFQPSEPTTENAYVRGRVTSIAPQLSGYLSEVDVQDFQQVQQGDLVARIDDRIFRQKLAQAEAGLEAAHAAFAVAEQNVRSAEAVRRADEAALASARAGLATAESDLTRAEELAEAGFVTGASRRNWAAYGAEVTLPENLPDWQRHLLTDPQTSGGLLVAVAPEAAEGWVRRLREAGYPLASVVGRVEEGEGVAVI